ncbi:hypothetical protein SYNPS1DRAFT_23103, partial [Syncephalis pseudoplumigaleata]
MATLFPHLGLDDLAAWVEGVSDDMLRGLLNCYGAVHLVQGLPFSEQYTPTPQIQVENIQWNYNDHRTSVIKVEFWDVVDRGIAADTPASPSCHGVASTMLLDAETVDVYRGASAVVLMFDVTREDTLDYVKQHLPEVPHGIPILVLVTAWLREYSEEQASTGEFVAEFIRYTEASLKNGQGLEYLYRFL